MSQDVQVVACTECLRDLAQPDFLPDRHVTNSMANFGIATICLWSKLRPNKKTLNPNDFSAEFKRRNFFWMAGWYLIDAWLRVRVKGTLLPAFAARNIR